MIETTSSATVSNMRNVSEINNAAATNIRKGAYEQAITELTCALKLLSKQIRGEATWESSYSTVRMPSAILGFATDCDGDGTETGERGAGMTAKEPTNIRFVVFRSPIVIQNGAELPPVTRSFEVVSYVILYNLALCWHLSGLVATEDSARLSLLRKSLSLYEHANKVTMSGGHVLNGDPLLYMALVCNMGTLYEAFDDDDKATRCHHLLVSAIMYCIDNSRREQTWNWILDSFLSDVMPSLFAPSAAPAA